MKERKTKAALRKREMKRVLDLIYARRFERFNLTLEVREGVIKRVTIQSVYNGTDFDD